MSAIEEATRSEEERGTTNSEPEQQGGPHILRQIASYQPSTPPLFEQTTQAAAAQTQQPRPQGNGVHQSRPQQDGAQRSQSNPQLAQAAQAAAAHQRSSSQSRPVQPQQQDIHRTATVQPRPAAAPQPVPIHQKPQAQILPSRLSQKIAAISHEPLPQKPPGMQQAQHMQQVHRPPSSIPPNNDLPGPSNRYDPDEDIEVVGVMQSGNSPGALRPRGSMQLTSERKRLAPGFDPFIKCYGCKCDLGGFLTEVATTTTKTVMLSCGHTVCPECLYKWRQACKADSHFKCQVCNQFVVDHMLPTAQEAIDRACEEVDCKFRDRFAASLYCNNCRKRMCHPCTQVHNSKYTGHNIIIMGPNYNMTASKYIQKNTSAAASSAFSRRHISCKMHNIPIKHRCECGELQCEKCTAEYETTLPDGTTIQHNRIPVGETDYVLEDQTQDTVGVQKRLRHNIEKLKKMRKEMCDNVDIMNNEICLHFNQIMMMAVRRAFDLIARIRLESDEYLKEVDGVGMMLESNILRLDAGLELDERTRNPGVLNNDTAADVYRAIGYSILSPAMKDQHNGISAAINLSDKLLRQPGTISCEYNTEAIFQSIANWGKFSSTMGPNREPEQLSISPTQFALQGFSGEIMPNFALKGSMTSGMINRRTYPGFPEGGDNEHLNDWQMRFHRMKDAKTVRMRMIEKQEDAMRQAQAQACQQSHSNNRPHSPRCAPPPSKQQVEAAKRAAAQRTVAAMAGQPLPVLPQAMLLQHPHAHPFGQIGRPAPTPANRHPAGATASVIPPIAHYSHPSLPIRPEMNHPSQFPRDLQMMAEKEAIVQLREIEATEKRESLACTEVFNPHEHHQLQQRRSQHEAPALSRADQPSSSRPAQHPQNASPSMQPKPRTLPATRPVPGARAPQQPSSSHVTQPLVVAVRRHGAPGEGAVLYRGNAVPTPSPDASSSAGSQRLQRSAPSTKVFDPSPQPKASINPTPERNPPIQSPTESSRTRSPQPMQPHYLCPPRACIPLDDGTLKVVIPRARLVSDEGRSRAKQVAEFMPDGVFDDPSRARANSCVLDEDGSHAFCFCCRDDGYEKVAKGCCDKCPRVYHPKCHVPIFFGDFAKDASDDWMCSWCNKGFPLEGPTEKDLTENEVLMMSKVLLNCYVVHHNSDYFNAFVDKEYAMGDFCKVSDSLRTINYRITNGLQFARGELFTYPDYRPYEKCDEFIVEMNRLLKLGADTNAKNSKFAAMTRSIWLRYRDGVKQHMPYYLGKLWIYQDGDKPDLPPDHQHAVKVCCVDSNLARKRPTTDEPAAPKSPAKRARKSDNPPTPRLPTGPPPTTRRRGARAAGSSTSQQATHTGERHIKSEMD